MTKRKPTALRLIEGNRGKRRLPKEAKVAPAIPTPPDFLSADAKAEWDRVSDTLYRAGLLTELDRATLAAYCQSYGRWAQAERALDRTAAEGAVDGAALTTTTREGNVIQAAIVGIARRAKADMLRAGKEFGLTPAARASVDAKPPTSENDELFS